MKLMDSLIPLYLPSIAAPAVFYFMYSYMESNLPMELVEAAAAGPGLPRAIYASSDLMAMAALRALYRLGIRVPDQVAVIGMTDIEMSQYANPPLTTIHVPVEEMGRTCAKVLAERIRGDESLPKRIILPSELVPRDSA